MDKSSLNIGRFNSVCSIPLRVIIEMERLLTFKLDFDEFVEGISAVAMAHEVQGISYYRDGVGICDVREHSGQIVRPQVSGVSSTLTGLLKNNNRYNPLTLIN